MFPHIKHIKSDNAHKISPLIKHEWLYVDDASIKVNMNLDGADKVAEKKELDILVEVI